MSTTKTKTIEITNRFTGAVIYSGQAETIRQIVEAAIAEKANLYGANLHEANLCGANLCGANLYGANLYGANLTPIRDDFWVVLSTSPAEVAGLRAAIVAGEIDGSTYENGYACLVGTLAKVRGCKYYAIPGLEPNIDRPAERFFLAIKPGDKPENSQFAKLALEWLDAWPPLKFIPGGRA